MNRAQSAPVPLAAMLSLAVVLVSAWPSIGSQPWALTTAIGAVGLLCLFFPPAGILPKSLLVLIGCLILLVGTAFLPATWFHAPYRGLLNDHGIDLPWTLSCQPWWTLEDSTLLLVTIFWAWLCLENRLTLEQRRFLIAGYLIGLGGLATIVILQGTSAAPDMPFFLRNAGQFENRNQTGDLLLMGGIFSLSWGFSELFRRRMLGLLWLLLAGIFMVAIIRNGSRAAVVLFGLGVILLVGLMPEFRRRHRLIQAAGLGLIICGTLIFAFVDAHLRDRFLYLLESGQDKRFLIYQDTVSMVRHGPWCGVGLGNFEGIFNIQRVQSAHFDSRCLHPDSDWLWIAAELGLVGVVLFALLIVMTFRIYLRKTPFRRLTHASITISILFLIHSLFDVGGHHIGTVWNCLYLVGFGAFRPGAPIESRLSRFFLRLAGFLLLVLMAFRIQSMSLHPVMPTRASLNLVEEPGIQTLPLPEQKTLLDQAIAWSPLDWTPYYLRAILHIQSRETPGESDADFNRALFLEQNSIELPVSIGKTCYTWDLPEALIAWKELLRRAGDRRADYLDGLYFYPGLDTQSRLQMTSLSEGDPGLQVISIVNQDPSQFTWLCENFLNSNPSLQGVTPALAKKLFDRWVDVGNADQFIDEWPTHPEWQSAGWRAYARALAKNGQYKQAVALALTQLPAPHLPDIHSQDLAEAQRLYQANPQDSFYLIQLCFAQLSAGANQDALATLKKIDDLPARPAYIPYLWVKALAATDQNETAWQIVEPMLKQAP